jgi:hypothetical protein
MKVDVYWNLHKGGYSIRAAEGPSRGLVVGYTDSITLSDAVFVVRESARQRVLRDRRKPVHAWVCGTVAKAGIVSFGLVGVTYDPYRWRSFTRLDTGEPVHSAKLVILETVNGKAHVGALPHNN